MRTGLSQQCVLSFILVAASISGGVRAEQSRVIDHPYLVVEKTAYPDTVYFGDTHVHTNLSLDAYLSGNEAAGPDIAYRFAKGEEVTYQAVSGSAVKRRLKRPLDFLVVADHAVNMGLYNNLAKDNPLLLETAQGQDFKRRFQKVKEADNLQQRFKALGAIGKDVYSGSIVVGNTSYRESVWSSVTKLADSHNAPGKFTTFSGFEWTPMKEAAHRVVVFADGADKVNQVLPFSRIDSTNPRELWVYMETYQQKTGGQALAILHGSNLSFGQGVAFGREDTQGKPLTREYANSRQRWEPLVEATQMKGDSETHPLLSPADEFADFERWNTWLGSHYDKSKITAPYMLNLISDAATPEKLQYKYVRSGLKQGLKQKAKLGVNPFKFGVIGSTDTHFSLSTADNDNYGIPDKERLFHVKGGVQPLWEKAASGYAAVWAEENSRSALFAAMKRKEVYATTGPRMKVRFFGGWNFSPDHALRPDLAHIGYSKGVPMGGELTHAPEGAAPRFLIRAVKDPDGANLDRVQVIKGWRDALGKLHEKIYNVALSDDRKKGPNGKVPLVGSTVNVADASYTNSIGDPELAAMWVDPDFNKNEQAFYYVRVLEIPTPRWTAYDAKYFSIKEVPEKMSMVTQERAYTSAIWYLPDND